MHHIIYKITNTINHKVYIGKHQTGDLNDGYMGSGKLIRRAINKYGIDNFIKEVLHVFDNELDMNNMEATIVDENFCKSENNYNLCPGGNGGFGYINQHKLNNTNKNKTCIYARISKSLSGRTRPDIGQGLRRAYLLGKKTSAVRPQYGNSYAAKKVRCVATGDTFNSVTDASLAKGCTPTNITRLIRLGRFEIISLPSMSN